MSVADRFSRRGPLTLRSAALQVPASHKNAASCEDAAVPDPGRKGYSRPKRVRLPSSQPVRLAVADGASTSSHAREWSRLLADAVSEGVLTHAGVREQLPLVQARWRDRCAARRRTQGSVVSKLFRTGAPGAAPSLSTLGVLEVSSSGDKPARAAWRFWGLGDSGLLWFRGGALHGAFPYTAADQFPRTPMLLSSVATPNGIAPEDFAVARGEAAEGDLLVLATDEIYRRLLGLEPATAHEWLDAIWRRPASMVRAIRAMQQIREMDDDDVTIVVARIINPDG